MRERQREGGRESDREKEEEKETDRQTLKGCFSSRQFSDHCVESVRVTWEEIDR